MSFIKWLFKGFFRNLFLMYMPSVATIIFALLMTYFFPDSGLAIIGLFCLAMLALSAYLGR